MAALERLIGGLRTYDSDESSKRNETRLSSLDHPSSSLQQLLGVNQRRVKVRLAPRRDERSYSNEEHHPNKDDIVQLPLLPERVSFPLLLLHTGRAIRLG